MKYNQKEYKNNLKGFFDLFKNIKLFIETSNSTIIKKYSEYFTDESTYTITILYYNKT